MTYLFWPWSTAQEETYARYQVGILLRPQTMSCLFKHCTINVCTFIFKVLNKPENCCGLKESEVLSLLSDIGNVFFQLEV